MIAARATQIFAQIFSPLSQPIFLLRRCSLSPLSARRIDGVPRENSFSPAISPRMAPMQLESPIRRRTGLSRLFSAPISRLLLDQRATDQHRKTPFFSPENASDRSRCSWSNSRFARHSQEFAVRTTRVNGRGLVTRRRRRASSETRLPAILRIAVEFSRVERNFTVDPVRCSDRPTT